MRLRSYLVDFIENAESVLSLKDTLDDASYTKELEKLIRKYKARYQRYNKSTELTLFSSEILNNISNGVHVYYLEDINDDRSLRLIATNPANEDLIGIPAKDLIGKTIDENFPGLRDKGIPELYANVIRSQKEMAFDDFYYSDDRVVESIFRVKAIPVSGNIMAAIFENVTELRLKEKESRERSEEVLLQNEEYEAINAELQEKNQQILLQNQEMLEINQRLAESERNYKVLIEKSPLPIIVHSENKFIYVNTAAINVVGAKSKEEVIGKNIWQFVDVDYHKKVQDRIEKIYNKKQDVGVLEERFIKVDGTKFFVEVTANQVDFNGKPASLVIFRDISDVKHLNEKLKFSEERYRSLFNNAGIAILVLKNDLIFDCNQKSHEIFQCFSDRLIGHSISEFDLIEKNKSHLIENVSTVSYETSQTFYHQLKRYNKSIFDASITITKFKTENEVFVMMLITDISDRIKAQNDFERIFNLSDNLICFIDNEGNFKRINQAVKKWLEYSDLPDNFQNIYGIIHPDDRDTFKKALNKISTYNMPYQGLECRIVKCEEEKWISWTMQYYESENIAFAVGSDISYLKDIEKDLKLARNRAIEADRLKTAFLANMSHEIRTPLNGIVGFTSLLAEEGLEKEKKDTYISFINGCSSQLLTLISDIVDLSKIESNQLKMSYSDINLNYFLKDLHAFFEKERAEKEKFNLKINIVPGLSDNDAVIKTDDVRLKQVFNNLLSNALKFTQKGSIDFGYNISDDSAKIIFFVKDTGIGVSEEDIKIIFDRFRQLENPETRKYGGTGLGLSICKGLVNLLGGEIWAESVLDEGSVFYFTVAYMPVKKIVEKKTVPELNDLPDWSGKKMLLIDDFELIHTYLTELLAKTNIQISYADSGEKALELLQKNKDFDIILMDIQLPDIDGLTLTLNIKKQFPELPVIIQTAYALSGDKEKAYNAGCDEYITKPFDKQRVFNLLNKFLN